MEAFRKQVRNKVTVHELRGALRSGSRARRLRVARKIEFWLRRDARLRRLLGLGVPK